MVTGQAKAEPADPAIYEKAIRLIVGRIALVLLLLIANFWRTGGLPDLVADENPDGLLLLFSFTFALSLVYFALLRFAPSALWQVRTQFAIDIVTITWLTWETGDIISPYVTLYIVLISVAGFFLGKTETLMLALVCALAFTTISILASSGILFSVAGEQPVPRVVQIVGVNIIAILLVGLLAARLSERRRLSEDLKHSEQSFADLHLLHERIVESIGSGLITTDLSGRIYAFNRAAEKITNMTSSDVIGKSVTEIFGKDLSEKVKDCLAAAQNGAGEAAYFESGFQNGSGPPRVRAACSVVPLLGKTGSMTGLIVTLQDVTDLRTLEESVRRSDRLAAVGRMAAGLAHEIRNPLGSMSSALQFLQESSARPEAETKLMDVVLRESDRLNNIISNFLAFARPAAHSFKANTEVIDVSSSLGDCVSLIRHSPEAAAGHRFNVSIDPQLRIEGEETQLKQVCWNLARNAIQAMPDGGDLSISAFAENGNVIILFEDSGIGMTREMLDRLFEPFVSGSGGTGLGLSIVHRIVQEHAGRISVESSPGKGTRVKVEFPRFNN